MQEEKKRSSSLGFLDFNRCAREVDIFVRSLDFDLNVNPMGLPKLMIQGDIIAVGQIEVLDELSQSLPGTITAIEPNFLKVASRSYEITLSQLQTLEGQPLEISDLIERFALQVGFQFEEIKPKTVRQMETFNSLIAEHEAFWVERLASLQPMTIPYADRTTPPRLQKRFAKVAVTVPEEVISCLDKNQNWNPGDFILAAFVGYLARIGGTNNFDLGLRYPELTSELNHSQGFFAASVPCHLDINLEQSFADFLTGVREQVELTKQHKTYSRDIVVRDPRLRSIPELASSEIFPVAIDRLSQIEEPQANLGSELTMVIPDHGRQWDWLYSVEALDEKSIARMVEQFTIFLQSIVQDLTQPLVQVSLLSEEEYHKILLEWNDTAVEYPQKCIHQLFEEQVERTPDVAAVVFEEQQLTYRELNHRGNQLAHYLQKLGVEPDVLVGICIERSLEMVVALLGVLKAGGAYLPLDPVYPQERISFMLQDTKVPVLLTSKSLVTRLPEHSAQVVCLDEYQDAIAQESQENLVTGVSLANLGYIIYTSGSTGKPKGVTMTQLALGNLIQWQLQNSKVSPQSKTLQFSPISFDVSFQEIFSTWSSGGTLVLIAEELRTDTRALLNLLKKQSVERLFLPFVALQQLAEVAESTELLPDKLKEIITAGEQLQITPAIAYLFSKLNQARLSNHYGPSESHVVTAFNLNGSVKNWSALPPIGRPIANTQIYILDFQLQPVPIGVFGELYIGGFGLAKGYLNRPELTAEKFIPNSFDHEKESYLYKTGDLARYLEDGNIEYLGRIDNQVKIRGFRIELGEVEVVLAQHPSIAETVVIAREDIPGDKRLVAYVIAQKEQLYNSELRSFLQERLPNYMIPSVFMFLDTLPRTPSGKVDRRALPAPDASNIQLGTKFVPPSNPTEERLANIWADVLGVRDISIHDNFFDLGGQSLLAARLFAQINETFQRKLTLSTIFQAPTIEQLAKVLSQSEYLPDSSYLVPIQPFGSKIPFFCIHGAQGEVLFLKSLTNHLSPDQPFYGIRSPGQNGETAPLTCIEDMAKLYIEEIKTIQPQGPYLLGGYSFGGLVAFEMAQQLQKQGQKVSLLALLDCYAPGSLRSLSLINTGIKHFRNFLAIGPDYVLKKLKTLRTKSLYRLFKGETMRNNYFYHLTSTKYFYNLINEFPNYTVQDLELWENLYKANLQASSNYIPSVYAGKITIFQVVVDPNEDFYQPVASCGWSELSNQEVELYDCPGDHYSFIEEPHVQVLARQLQACLMSANEL
jgi:amino acid adenylation domain-containing protein